MVPAFLPFIGAIIETMPNIPHDLLYSDATKLQNKIADFKRVGAGQLQLIFDFDRTLTVSLPGANGDITTWHILNEHLPQAGKDRYQESFKKYRAMELAGTMNPAHALEWWSDILGLFVAYHIDLAEVEKDFLSKATIRPGAKELFDLCAAHHIPTIILSAGIKDIIDLWARSYTITPTIVLSTSLKIDSSNRVCGWDKNSLVHVFNKKEIGHRELTKIHKTHDHTILVGDSMNDADMADGTNNVIRIRIHDPRDDEKTATQRISEQTFQLFDAMIETGGLAPVRELVEHIVAVS
jgi:HAD superfamily hydrolase (TIGR01544 family)